MMQAWIEQHATLFSLDSWWTSTGKNRTQQLVVARTTRSNGGSEGGRGGVTSDSHSEEAECVESLAAVLRQVGGRSELGCLGNLEFRRPKGVRLKEFLESHPSRFSLESLGSSGFIVRLVSPGASDNCRYNYTTADTAYHVPATSGGATNSGSAASIIGSSAAKVLYQASTANTKEGMAVAHPH